MNSKRRAKIQEAVQNIYDANLVLAECWDEETEAYDNLPEGIQDSERGERMEGYAEALDDAIDTIQDTIDSLVEQLDLDWIS